MTTSVMVDPAARLPDLTPEVLDGLSEPAKDYLRKLDQQLHFLFRDSALRDWALETTLGNVSRRAGTVTAQSVSADRGSAAAPSITFANDPDTGFYNDSDDNQLRLALAGALAMIFNPNFLYIVSDTGFVGFGTNADTKIARVDANTLAVADSTNNPLDLSLREVITSPVAVAGLPAAAAGLKGARAFVTDANATAFYGVVAGGGANNVPVFCDGTNWRIGG